MTLTHFYCILVLNHWMSLSLSLQWVVGENGVLKPKRVNPNVYQPPSLRGTVSSTTGGGRMSWFVLVFASFVLYRAFAAVDSPPRSLCFMTAATNGTKVHVTDGLTRSKSLYFIPFFACVTRSVTGMQLHVSMFPCVSALYCTLTQHDSQMCVWKRKREIRVWQLWDTKCESRKVWIIPDYGRWCIQLWRTRTHTGMNAHVWAAWKCTNTNMHFFLLWLTVVPCGLLRVACAR